MIVGPTLPYLELGSRHDVPLFKHDLAHYGTQPLIEILKLGHVVRAIRAVAGTGGSWSYF
jgi:hypothetical protein